MSRTCAAVNANNAHASGKLLASARSADCLILPIICAPPSTSAAGPSLRVSTLDSTPSLELYSWKYKPELDAISSQNQAREREGRTQNPARESERQHEEEFSLSLFFSLSSVCFDRSVSSLYIIIDDHSLHIILNIGRFASLNEASREGKE